MAELSREDDGDSDSDEPREKRVRFPKGRKVKPGKVKPGEEKIDAWKISDEVHKAPIAAKELALRQFTDKLAHDISTAEVQYEEHEINERYEDHGRAIDLFNLENEREEGYFDENGYYIEYVNKEIEDAWLDSDDNVKVDRTLANKGITATKVKDDVQDLTTKDLAQMKRRMAAVLEPEETVLHALRRLKGTSNNRKGKMSAEKKIIFDQLTEDAMTLLEDDVYHEKQKVIELEAAGYERLAKREQQRLGVFAEDDGSNPITSTTLGVHEDDGKAAANPTLDESNLITSQSLEGGGYERLAIREQRLDVFAEDDRSSIDMFAEDDGKAAENPVTSTTLEEYEIDMFAEDDGKAAENPVTSTTLEEYEIDMFAEDDGKAAENPVTSTTLEEYEIDMFAEDDGKAAENPVTSTTLEEYEIDMFAEDDGKAAENPVTSTTLEEYEIDMFAEDDGKAAANPVTSTTLEEYEIDMFAEDDGKAAENPVTSTTLEEYEIDMFAEDDGKAAENPVTSTTLEEYEIDMFAGDDWKAAANQVTSTTLEEYEIDMFAEDDGKAAANPTSDESNLITSQSLEGGGYERLAIREQRLDVFAEDDRSSIDMFAEDDGKAAANPTSDESNLITSKSSQGGNLLRYAHDEATGLYEEIQETASTEPAS